MDAVTEYLLSYLTAQKKWHNAGSSLNDLTAGAWHIFLGAWCYFYGVQGAEHHSPAYLQLEFLGRNKCLVSTVTMCDVTGCNLGSIILSYQNKHLWLLPCKQSSTSHCTLSYGLPLPFCMSKTGKKKFSTHQEFLSSQYSSPWFQCAVLCQLASVDPGGRGGAGTGGLQARSSCILRLSWCQKRPRQRTGGWTQPRELWSTAEDLLQLTVDLESIFKYHPHFFSMP